MRRYGLRPKVYHAAGAVSWAAGIGGTLVAASLKADTTKIPPAIASWLVQEQRVAWILIPALLVMSGTCALVRRNIGEPWVWGAIHDLIDSYRSYVFATLDGPMHYHRVTLFRHYAWWRYPCCLKRPLGAKLVPVERSGHTTQKSSVAFCVPDHADKVEGIAGQTWATWKTLKIMDLPDVYADPSEATIQEYARQTWTRPEWVRARYQKKQSLGLSFCGIPVRVKGKPWGIIILDSRSPDSLQNSDDAFLELMGRTLGKLLERV